MGELIMAAPVAGLAAKNRILPEDVVMLRQDVFRDGVITHGEAESLFALDQTCKDKCAEWPGFFIEAITDYIVHQEKPSGYISVANAEWLVRVISRDGMVDTLTELEILVVVLEKAKSAPESLAVYALEQVSHAVLAGKGPLAASHAVPGVIDKSDVDLLRRILHAFGGSGNIAITRSEAEVVFALNDATAEEMNDPSWNDLFVKAMASFVMRASGYEVPTRQEALRRDAFFESTDADIGGFFARMVAGGVRGILDAYSAPDAIEDDWGERNRLFEARNRHAEMIHAAEAQWLAERIGRDGLLHDNERALLAYIKSASPSIHPDLKPLLDKVA